MARAESRNLTGMFTLYQSTYPSSGRQSSASRRGIQYSIYGIWEWKDGTEAGSSPCTSVFPCQLSFHHCFIPIYHQELVLGPFQAAVSRGSFSSAPRIIIIIQTIYQRNSLDSSVDIATGYVLDGRDSIPVKGKEFICTPQRPVSRKSCYETLFHDHIIKWVQ